MMLSQEKIEQAAKDLLEAERTGVQTGLLSVKYPEITLHDAYAIQSALMREKLEAGLDIIGWKIGLTSKIMQQALGIDTPDSGVLFDNMAFANGSVVKAGRFIQPRVETEIAFVLKSAIDGEVTREDVLAATDYVAPSIEILDTRILRQDPETGVARRIFDTVSDNAANGGIVLGEGRFDPCETDLRWSGAIVFKNEEVVATGLGAAVLNDPVEGIVWLARRMHQYGQRMEAGQVVLSGSFIAPVECPPGSRIDADFGQMGTVCVSFA